MAASDGPGNREFLITDVGSTMTKAVLIAQRDGEYRLCDWASSPTTVEAPYEDVTVGAEQAIAALARKTGRNLWIDDRPIANFLSTSSAGGGLQVLVIGHVQRLTGQSAHRAALGAGAIILDLLCSDDGRLSFEKLERIRNLHPDMILLAGGIEGGNTDYVLELCDLINAAHPQPRFGQSFRIPVIYAGNSAARELVLDTLDESFVVKPVANLRPALDREDLEPTRQAIAEEFMTHVMSVAPGYRRLASWTRAPILPTPLAAGRMMEAIARTYRTNVLGVDIGGATTDVFTVIGGQFHRSVAANLGMSYSAGNVLAEAGPQNILRWLPWPLDEKELRNAIATKVVHPTRLPVTTGDLLVEQAVAREAMRLALEQHRQIAAVVPPELSPAQRALLSQEQQLRAARPDPLVKIMDVGLIIGSGGVLSHAPRREQAALMLIDAFAPEGITALALDSVFVLPHLGVLAEVEPAIAMEVLQKDGLVWLGTVIAPTGRITPGQPALTLELSGPGIHINETVNGGDLMVLPLPAGREATVTVAPSARLDAGGGPGRPVTTTIRGGEVGVIIDARGRPLPGMTPAAMAGYLLAGRAFQADEIQLPAIGRGTPDRATAPAPGRISRRRYLPYLGDVLVRPGDAVEPNTPVARLGYLPGRLVRVRAAAELNVPPAILPSLVTVRSGDRVQAGHLLAGTAEFFRPRAIRAPIDGIVGLVSRHLGYIYLREPIPLGATENVEVDVAGALGVPPRAIGNYLAVDVGRVVFTGQPVAKRYLGPASAITVPSPIYGRLVAVDPAAGKVTLAPLFSSTEVPAYIRGRVAQVSPTAVDIEATAIVIPGVYGVGGETWGRLVVLAGPGEDITVDRIRAAGPGLDGTVIAGPATATAEALLAAREAGVRGVILAYLAQMDLCTLAGGEINMAITGQENLGVTVVLIEGFWPASMPPHVWRVLVGHEGETVSLNGTTQIRSGVIRPEVIITTGEVPA